jgi:hypothetical protein
MARLHLRFLIVPGSLALALCVSACAGLGSSGSTPTPTSTPTTAPTATPSVSVASMTVSGAVAGSFTGGTVRTARGVGMSCQRLQSSTKRYSVTIPGQIGDKVYDVSIFMATFPTEAAPDGVDDYVGPGSYTQAQYVVTFGPDYDLRVTKTVLPYWLNRKTTDTGTVTINKDEQSGTLDVSLSSLDYSNPSAPVTQVHVTGTWYVSQPCVVIQK